MKKVQRLTASSEASTAQYEKRKVVIMRQIIVDNISTWYYITEDGKCYNSKTDKYLKGQYNYKNGYLSYNITLPDGSKKRVYAHRMVALAYIPNDNPKRNQVNHIDGDKTNNYVDNLEWCTSLENVHHSMEHELKKFPHVYCFNKDKKLIAEYRTISEAAKAVGISESTIKQELFANIKSLKGNFYWSRETVLGETKNYTNNGKAKEVNQYDLNGKYIMTYPSTNAAARAIGASKGTHIGECCRGKLKTFKGYIWRYTEDIVSPSMKVEETVSETVQE